MPAFRQPPWSSLVPQHGPTGRRAALLARLMAAVAVWLALGFALGLATTVHARDRDGDHDRARAALQSGEVLPLATVLERLRRRDPGEVLGVELEREDGRWVYEIRLLRSGGELVRLDLDARTAEVLRERRRRDGR